MNPSDFFQQIPSMTTNEVRGFLNGKDVQDYNLIDVRQPGEYEQSHLPGARLIPLGELAVRVGDIDASKPTIVYCRSGNRSMAATTTLLGAGLKQVFNMAGGITAWSGLVSSGPPEAGMAYFTTAAKPEELIALAWALEEGSRRFYASVARALEDRDAAELFEGLVSAEEQHKTALLGLYREMAADARAPEIPAALLSGATPGDVMEGGVAVQKALAWTKGKGVNDILDLAISLESHAFDLSVRMERAVEDDRAKRVFRTLAREEQAHLNSMTSLLEKRRFPEA